MGMKYDNCKDCYSLCVHAGKDREFVCMNGVSCKIAKAKPKTNADRIGAMKDEELAKLLCCTGWRMIEQKECLEWLQQPAEGE